MRACLAAAESAVVSVFLTAFAPGIVEFAKTLSFSRWVRSVLVCSGSLAQAARARTRTAPANATPGFDMNGLFQVGVLDESCRLSDFVARRACSLSNLVVNRCPS